MCLFVCWSIRKFNGLQMTLCNSSYTGKWRTRQKGNEGLAGNGHDGFALAPLRPYGPPFRFGLIRHGRFQLVLHCLSDSSVIFPCRTRCIASFAQWSAFRTLCLQSDVILTSFGVKTFYVPTTYPVRILSYHQRIFPYLRKFSYFNLRTFPYLRIFPYLYLRIFSYLKKLATFSRRCHDIYVYFRT